ncbi:hypothetical protein GCM10009535_42450 [Streptomyces thermocarboxydovorans]|uniref:Isochorismatase-like domain-containing protein n=1 Tax=Streptomyces thermocarboxydovorans TaxID=59298 RepID=A0ABN1HM82_9ACTN
MSIDRIYEDPYTAPRFASSALITIDVQRDFLSEAPHGIAGTTEVLPQIRQVASAFRATRRPVIHIVRVAPVAAGSDSSASTRQPAAPGPPAAGSRAGPCEPGPHPHAAAR